MTRGCDIIQNSNEIPFRNMKRQRIARRCTITKPRVNATTGDFFAAYSTAFDSTLAAKVAQLSCVPMLEKNRLSEQDRRANSSKRGNGRLLLLFLSSLLQELHSVVDLHPVRIQANNARLVNGLIKIQSKDCEKAKLKRSTCTTREAVVICDVQTSNRC